MPQKRPTRRQIALALTAMPATAVPLIVGVVPAQQPTPAKPAPAARQAGPSTLEKAQEDVRQVSERLRKVEIPMDLEPAFAFRP